MYTKSRDLPQSHDHVGIEIHNNGGFSASERGWVIKTYNFLVNHHLILIILADHQENIQLMWMVVFHEGDNSLQFCIHSCKSSMEISIGDLTF